MSDASSDLAGGRAGPPVERDIEQRYPRPEKECQSFSLISHDRSLDIICKDKDEAEVWFAGLKTLISRSHQRKWRTESRSDIISSGATSPRTYTRRSSPLSSPFSSNDSVHKDGSDHYRLRSPFGSPPKNVLDKAFSDVVLYAVPPKAFFPSDSNAGSVHSMSSAHSDNTNGHPRGIPMDAFRVSYSSAISSSSHGSGHDDGDALGDVFIWGEGTGEGLLGGGSSWVGSSSGAKMDHLLPKPLEFAVRLDVQNISCGGRHAALVTKQGEIYSWGEESGGRLGHGVDCDVAQPKLIDSLAHMNIELVACGEYHTCAVTLSGDLYTWGDGTFKFGLLGHGNDVSHWVPKRVDGPLEGIHVSSISCGPWHTALVTSAGQLFTFGDGSFGVLGHGDRAIALTTSGHVYTMGSAVYGQLGNPQADGLLPVRVEGKLHKNFVEEISCGAYHVAVLTSRTEVYTWGKGAHGRLGHGDTDDKNTPTLVEALKDKQVRSVVCGINFTAAICIHKWVSGSDQSMCSGCRQPFNLRRKRHNCYNCALVFCHSCSSKKSLKASLAPNPNKPYRVCDSCYSKLTKGLETDTNSSTKRGTVIQGFNDTNEEELETRSNAQLSRLSSMESLKNMDSRYSKKNKKFEFNSTRVSPVPNGSSHWSGLNISRSFNPVFGSSKKFFSASVPGSRIVSRATSPISRRTSPPRSTTPTPTLGGLTSPRVAANDAKPTNDSLSHEVLNLRSQVENLTRKSHLLEVELERTTKQLKEAIVIAGEETAKCKAAKEVIKSLTAQLKGMADRLPGGVTKNSKLPPLSGIPVPNEISSMATESLGSPSSLVEQISNGPNGLLASNGPSSARNKASHLEVGKNRSRLLEAESCHEAEWVEQDEPGVYITLTALPGGARDLKRVRFSRKRFSETQAEQWWQENRARVYQHYNVRMVDKSVSSIDNEIASR
uniref:FYVE-type domain-containing protein n=1 Tax=Leersia perrieri TaxID=77586 RepID=A0A0D9VAA9_9ORYZ